MQATPGSSEDPTVIDVVILNSYFWTTAACVTNIKIETFERVCVCVWGKQLMLCILTVHLNPSLFILRQIAMAREVNKHAVWLALAADVFQLKAVWFYEFLSHCGGARGSWSGGLGQSLREWFSGNLIRLWRLYTHTRTVGRFAASAMNRLNV